MTLAILSLTGASGTVTLITLAQALTVLGLPALGLTLLYLGTRPELTGDRQVPRGILGTCFLGFLVSCVLACSDGVHYLWQDHGVREEIGRPSVSTYFIVVGNSWQAVNLT